MQIFSLKVYLKLEQDLFRVGFINRDNTSCFKLIWNITCLDMGGYPDEINSVWEDIRMRWTLYGRKSGSDELCTVGFPDEMNFVWEDIRMRG